MGRAIVLASGGLDSTVTAAIAKQDGHDLYFLTVAYGQRHSVEVERARQIAEWMGAREHKVLEMDLRVFGGSALTDDYEVPVDCPPSQRGSNIPITYVPARNTIFLSLALAYAEVREAETIYFGANVVDYSGYPDCRPEFVQAFLEVAKQGTRFGSAGGTVAIETPLIRMTKAEIIKTGLALKVPFHLTHSCYAPLDDGRACGRCDSCLIRREGFRVAGVRDPGER